MSKIIPISLRKNYNKVRSNISNVLIVDTADMLVENDMTLNMLINKVSVALLHRDDINRLNDMTLSFRQNLLMHIEEVIGNRYQSEDRIVKYFDKDGNFVEKSFPHIVGEAEPAGGSVHLFRDPKENQPFVTLKGSEKKMDNKSQDILDLYSSVTNKVRDGFDPQILKLYSALEYERNKHSVNQDMLKYKAYMVSLAEETELYMGHEYADHRKLDSSSRDFALARFGHSYAYGDSFQKWLVQPILCYTVSEEDAKIAKEYIYNEFKVKSWFNLYRSSVKKIDSNLLLLDDWAKGLKVEFSMEDGKELGKACHIIAIVQNIIGNVGNATNEVIPFDLTNSGGIMFASQFGDEKWCTATNLIGKEKQDSHQNTADFLNIDRNSAKKVFQGPNHGARLTETTEPVAVAVFGEQYKVINRFAEYGKKLLMNGVTHVEFIAPDGVKSYFNGYTLNGELDINGTKVNAVLPFSTLDIGVKKGYSMATKVCHPVDAYIIREVRTAFIKAGLPCMTILDSYSIRPSARPQLLQIIYNALDKVDGWFLSHIDRIERETGILMDNKPKTSRTVAIERTGNII